MPRSAHQAAIDQAHLIAIYLNDTPPAALDLHFIRRHLDALREFAQAAKAEYARGGPVVGSPRTGEYHLSRAGDPEKHRPSL